jgi:hypothetical protein
MAEKKTTQKKSTTTKKATTKVATKKVVAKKATTKKAASGTKKPVSEVNEKIFRRSEKGKNYSAHRSLKDVYSESR